MIPSLKLNEKLKDQFMLEDLLNFDDCHSVIDIENKFLIISKEIFSKYLIFNEVTKKYYAMNALELFINFPKIHAEDPYIHQHSQQLSKAKWYIHQHTKYGKIKTTNYTGLSITCGGREEYYASITIQSLIEIGYSRDIQISKNDFLNNPIDGISKALQFLGWEHSITKKNRKWSEEEKDRLLKIEDTKIMDTNPIINLIKNDNSIMLNSDIESHPDKRKTIEKSKKMHIARDYLYRNKFSFVLSDLEKELKQQVEKIQALDKKHKVKRSK